jgi:dihydroorotate dehydrogenase electron transfer subunit
MLKCAPGLHDNPLLRRPFSIFDVDPAPGTGRPRGLDLLVKEIGAGSRLLAHLRPGQEIYVLGPQGRPFETSTAAGRLALGCLVAGGVGIAALYLLARRLLERDARPVLFYGARTEADLVLRDRFESLGIETFYATEDGSLGERGVVTTALDRFLSTSMRAGARIFACGPWAMMKAAHQLAVRCKVPCDVSLEARMGCSLGACMGCVVRTTDDTGDDQYLRVCLEGPVMESRRVDWDTPPL